MADALMFKDPLDELDYLRWHSDLCREDARRFYSRLCIVEAALASVRDGLINLRPARGPMERQMTKHIVAIDAVLNPPHSAFPLEPKA